MQHHYYTPTYGEMFPSPLCFLNYCLINFLSLDDVADIEASVDASTYVADVVDTAGRSIFA
jgi:hypothetical protein